MPTWLTPHEYGTLVPVCALLIPAAMGPSGDAGNWLPCRS
jgi:hypothetical protein